MIEFLRITNTFNGIRGLVNATVNFPRNNLFVKQDASASKKETIIRIMKPEDFHLNKCPECSGVASQSKATRS